MAHWTAQIPLEITCYWNKYTAFSREECRGCFFIRAKQRKLPSGHETMCDDLSRWKAFWHHRAATQKKTGTPGQVTNIGSNEYMYHKLKIPRTEKGQLSLVTMHSNLTTKCNNNPKNNFYCHPTSQSPTSKQSLQTNKGWNSEMTLRTSVTASAAALSWWQAATLGRFTQTTWKKQSTASKHQQQCFNRDSNIVSHKTNRCTWTVATWSHA